MGPDELGYVYEGLLELVPQITGDIRSFSFAGADESRGHARKTTGSYYTPDQLVQRLLASALDPVIEQTIDAHPEDTVDALLELAIVDPACGSGHFLLAAARRLADRVARIRAGGTPTPDDYQRALRDVVRRCIYGVDRNTLAVEICKVGLWMESIEPGLPLTFLESHVRCGNSLIGTSRALMGDQVPDAAWAVLEGDDRKVTQSLKRRNRDEIAGQKHLLFEPRIEAGTLDDAMRAVEQAPDTDIASLAEKQGEWKALLASPAFEHEKLVADAWCAAFLWPKDELGPVAEAAPTTAAWLALRDEDVPPSPVLVETTRRIVEDYGLFHWELAFPHVFARGGFDVVLGNPPWERVKLQEKEFFAKREPSIVNARNAAERKKRIAALPATNPALWMEWTRAMRIAHGQSHFARQSGRYPLCGTGDVNTYALFAEHNWRVLAPRGCAGFIAPSGIVTDDTTKAYFPGASRPQRPCQCSSLRERESRLQGSRPQVPVRAPDGPGIPSGRPCLLRKARGRSRRPVATLHADARRFRRAQPEHADLSNVQVTSRRSNQLGDVPPRGRAVAGGRPGRESMGLAIPEHVSHGQRLWSVSHEGRSGRRRDGGWTRTGSRRTGRSCCLCTRQR